MITSPQNLKIKWVQKLIDKARERKRSGLFVVEGEQENRFCLMGGYTPEFFLVHQNARLTLDLPTDCSQTLCAPEVYEKISYRKQSGVVGVYQFKPQELSELNFSTHAKIVVLEGIEKPGNLGAILRTCEAAGVAAVLMADPHLDVYNPNVIRSSVGTRFLIPVVASTKEEIQQMLEDNGFKIYTTHMTARSKNYKSVTYNGRVALVFGTESTGLTPYFLEKSHENLLIPMFGKVNSLNLSNSVAIMVYEAMQIEW